MSFKTGQFGLTSIFWPAPSKLFSSPTVRSDLNLFKQPSAPLASAKANLMIADLHRRIPSRAAWARGAVEKIWARLAGGVRETRPRRYSR